MQHITGISRQQLQISSLGDRVFPDNPVRFIEAFIEHISLQALGFTAKTIKTQGRPSFDIKLFFKIYLYGYLGGLQSSRKLEKECFRNIELQWLLCGIVPNYHSISDFRKENPVALKNLFKLFVSFLKDIDLIAGETIAIDGTKSRATYNCDFNAEPQKQYIILLDVGVEIETSLGEKRTFNTGDVLLVEDIIGQGHKTKNVEIKPRKSIFLIIE